MNDYYVIELTEQVGQSKNISWSTADVLGVLGFLLALVLGCFEIYRWWESKPRLKISVSDSVSDMDINQSGDVIISENYFWVVTVSNPTNHEIKIEQLGLFYGDRVRVGADAFLPLTDSDGDEITRILAPHTNTSYSFLHKQYDINMFSKLTILDGELNSYSKKI